MATARELFVAEDVRNVSLRQIADRIEYSPAAFYTYFRCKEDIFLALAEEDAAVLDRRVYEAAQDVVNPLARIRRALWAVYEFLNANPLFVELMILDNSVPRMTAGRQRFDHLRGMLGAASVARRLARHEECDVLAHDLLETLLAGLSTAPCQRRESDLESASPETSA